MHAALDGCSSPTAFPPSYTRDSSASSSWKLKLPPIVLDLSRRQYLTVSVRFTYAFCNLVYEAEEQLNGHQLALSLHARAPISNRFSTISLTKRTCFYLDADLHINRPVAQSSQLGRLTRAL